MSNIFKQVILVFLKLNLKLFILKDLLPVLQIAYFIIQNFFFGKIDHGLSMNRHKSIPQLDIEIGI